VAQRAATQRNASSCRRRQVLLRGYAKEGAQSFTFQEIEAIETPDKYTVRIHLKTPRALPAERGRADHRPLSREVLEEDGDLKKR